MQYEVGRLLAPQRLISALFRTDAVLYKSPQPISVVFHAHLMRLKSAPTDRVLLPFQIPALGAGHWTDPWFASWAVECRVCLYFFFFFFLLPMPSSQCLHLAARSEGHNGGVCSPGTDDC